MAFPNLACCHTDVHMLCLFSGTDCSSAVNADHPDDAHVVTGDMLEPPHHLATLAVSMKDGSSAFAPGDSSRSNIVPPSPEEGSMERLEVIIAFID